MYIIISIIYIWGFLTCPHKCEKCQVQRCYSGKKSSSFSWLCSMQCKFVWSFAGKNWKCKFCIVPIISIILYPGNPLFIKSLYHPGNKQASALRVLVIGAGPVGLRSVKLQNTYIHTYIQSSTNQLKALNSCF